LSNMRHAPASPSRTYNRFVPSTTRRKVGGNCTSSAKTKLRLPTLPVTRQQVSTLVSVTSQLSHTAPRKPTCTPETV
jgi:hypothetical protein